MRFIKLLAFLLVVFVLSCKEDEQIPVVDLPSIDSISYDRATANGLIESIGTSALIEKGFCYSTENPPTTHDNLVLVSTQDSLFSGVIDSLLPGCQYFIRAFASNLTGTAYSAVDSFVTLSLKQPSLMTNQVGAVTRNTATLSGLIIESGGLPISECGFCYATHPEPGFSDNVSKSETTKSTFTIELTDLTSSTQYFVRAFATNREGTGFGEVVSFTTQSPELPVVVIDSIFNITIQNAVGQAYVDSDGGASVTERGICWSTNGKPTINDSKQKSGYGNGRFWAALVDLNSGKTYYAAAYAINSAGVAYSNVVTFRTIATQVTYTLHKSGSPTATELEMYALIEKAMNEACAYYSQYTDYNKHLNVYYNPGVPTADASYNGTIRFGQKAYMQKITAMHEIAHTFGVGTSPRWGNYMVNGSWTGAKTTAMLRQLTNNPAATIKGDGMHFWPYGLNYTSEVKSDNDLIIHCKIVNAMLKDGL